MHGRSWCFARQAATALALVIAASCSESPTTPGSPGGGSAPQPVNIEWQHPYPLANDLYRMWGFPDGTFYAVGDAGTVVHFDGTTPNIVDTPVREDLKAIWAGAPDHVYAAGSNGTLIVFDGATWTLENTPTHEDLDAIWVNTADEVFVTGTGGSVWQRHGSSWTEYAVAPGQQLMALWGYGADELYVAGSLSSLYRFDGAQWTKVPLTLTPNARGEIRDLWGPGPGAFSYVGGTSIIWFDGTSWGYRTIAAATHVFGLWGFSLNNQVAISAGASTNVVNGVSSYYNTPSTVPLFDVWGNAMDDLFAVGRDGQVAHFDGTVWQAMNEGTTKNLRDLWITPTGGVAVGASGRVLHQQGSDWTEETVGSRYDLSGVWSDGNTTVAVGRSTPDGYSWHQAIVLNDGTSWVDAGVVGQAPQLFDVWGISSSDIYAVGWAGEVLHYDGNTWTVVATLAADTAFLRSVNGSSADNVIAVGRTDDLRGLVCSFDGMAWTKTILDGVEQLNAVWVESPASAYAVGSLGVIQHYDGMSWSSMPSPTQETLLSVWGSSSDDVYASGWSGTILHYDGARWTPLLPATHRNLNAVSGRSSGEVYFAGDRGAVFRLRDS